MTNLYSISKVEVEDGFLAWGVFHDGKLIEVFEELFEAEDFVDESRNG